MPGAAYCDYCRKPMPEPWPGQKYCKRGCKENARKQRARASDRARRQCIVCATPLDADSARRLYCSAECARLVQRHQVRQWHYENGKRRDLSLLHFHIGHETEYDAASYREMIRHDPCAFCGRPAAHIDHITPRFHDGADTWDNLTPLCHLCNQRKGAEGLLIGLLRCDGLRRARTLLRDYGHLFGSNVHLRSLDVEQLVG